MKKYEGYLRGFLKALKMAKRVHDALRKRKKRKKKKQEARMQKRKNQKK